MKRLRDRSASDNHKSFTHYQDQQIGKERRVQTAKKNWESNEKRVNDGMRSFNGKLLIHNNRASSARSEKVEIKKQKRLLWEDSIERQKEQSVKNFESTFKKDIER